MKFSLNRFNIIGYLDYYTPLVVIQEIMRCMGDEISIEDIDGNLDVILKYIRENEKEIEIKNDYTEEELNDISLFVSQKETSWKTSNLIKAFEHIVYYDTRIPKGFVYGEKTNNHPLSYDSTMLYAFCLENGIATNKNDTIKELSVYTRLSFAKRHVLLEALVSKIPQMDNFSLINSLKNSKISFNEFNLSENSLVLVNNLKNTNYTRMVTTNEEAVVYACKNFNMDISSSTCPSRELLQLYKSEHPKFFLEDNFTRRFSINPYFYNTTKFWKSNLSTLYNDKMTMTLLNNECVNHKDISDPKQFLYELTLTNNIYQGIIPTCSYTQTFIYKTPFDEINKKHIISYGILDSNDLIALTPEEIINFLKTHKDFKDFKNEGEILSERNLKKLILLCKNFPLEESYAELLSTIRETKMLGNVINARMKEFISYFKGCDVTTKQKINDIFEKLFELGMTMRGWDGESDYPLSEKDCTNYEKRYEEIENRVTERMRELNENINSMSDTTKIIIKSLPLIKLSERDKSFYRSTNYDEGLSFYERLMLISTKPESVYACLRLSSNYLVSTSQYYNVLLNSKNYIDINNLEFIQ
jgi:hypothetical protein